MQLSVFCVLQLLPVLNIIIENGSKSWNQWVCIIELHNLEFGFNFGVQ